jgi:arginine-tRNA-protein transferase
MFAQAHRPQTLSPTELDRYLEQGWFRMGQTIFTTSFLNFKGTFYDAVWLRIRLDEFSGDNTQEKLIRKNEAFRVIVQPMRFTVAKEELYDRYRKSLSFEASPSLSNLLYGKVNYNIYETYELNVYDNDQLIAVGIFDLGKESAAGITSFYEPAYKRFSLGKYLIYMKINYCKVKGLNYFYPGYFVPGYTAFDYKLNIGKSALQYYSIESGEWLPIRTFSYSRTPLQLMFGKLRQLNELLLTASIKGKILYYEFFDANLIPDLQGMEFFDFPLIYYGLDITKENVQPIVVYDVMRHLYRLYRCTIIWSPEDDTSGDDNDDSSYAHLLKVQDEIYASDDARDIVAELSAMQRWINEDMTN